MFDKIKPLYDRVLVQRMEATTKTAGGIIIPDTAAQDKTQMGKVLAVGSGRVTNDGRTIPMQVHVGDVVYFGKYAGTDAGDDHLIIREDEILGVVEK